MALTVLDAGVVIGLLDREDPHHTAAVEVFDDLRRRRHRAVLPIVAYAEVLVGPMRVGGGAPDRVNELVRRFPVQLADTTAPIARAAAGLRARHGRSLRLPDALVIATGLVLEAERIVTTDRGWPDGLGIRIEVAGSSSG